MGMIKTKEEIKLLRKSAEITNSCIPLIKKSLEEKGITEKEIARRIRRKIEEQGAKEAFRTIVACGKRSAKIHPKPRSTNRIIFGLGYIDFGASYKGYKTDVTVPFIKGKICKEARRIVQATLKAYKLAIRLIKTGENCWKVYEKVNKFLIKHGFEMRHSLGHGIGRKVHEMPFIIKFAKEQAKRLKRKEKLKWKRIWKVMKNVKFQPGMVFTIEPAVYVEGLGGCRIENVILLKNEKVKSLTKASLLEI